MKLSNVNWVAVIVTIVACGALGFLWYGVLFLDTWAAGNGIVIDKANETMSKGGVTLTPSNLSMVYNSLSMLVYALVMHWLLSVSNMNNLKGGLTMGLVLGILNFVGICVGNVFAVNPFSLSAVDGSYAIILWLIIGAIIGGWQKRSSAAA